jgi:hypothetical protein
MELNEFLQYVDAHLDPESDESVQSLAPQLRELGANKRFVAQFLASELERPDFQQDNRYIDSALVIVRRPTYTIRVVGWPPHFYSPDSGDIDREAHTHCFSLLTYGYLGPGYQTEMYACDPNELMHSTIGDTITLGDRQPATLAEGSTIFFPAFRVAHIQHPPSAYSVSLNLMVHPRNEQGFEQYLVNPRQGVLTGMRGMETENALHIMRLASYLNGSDTAAIFQRIACSHRLRTVREHAATIALSSLTSKRTADMG